VIFSTDEFNDSRLDSKTRQPLWKWQPRIVVKD
jgi:hypothetical protein